MKKIPHQDLLENGFFIFIAILLLYGQISLTAVVLLFLGTIICSGLIYLQPLKYFGECCLLASLVGAFVWWPIFYFIPALLGFYLTAAINQLAFLGMLGVVLASLLFGPLQLTTAALLIVLSMAITYLAIARQELSILRKNFFSLKDDSFQRQQLLTEKNAELLATQEQLVAAELTEERNRIARDIHDNVGHLLSSSLLQLGALQTLNQQENLRPAIIQLNETVNAAMTSIRASVHNTFQTSLSFDEGLALLLQDFYGAKVIVSGKFSELPQAYAQPLLMVIKEALVNVAKHSDATEVTISFSELPAFFKCVIKDNGTLKQTSDVGIGLVGIQKRLAEIQGQLHVNPSSQVFALQVILPKKLGERGSE